jgi:YbbR domain-containing protein
MGRSSNISRNAKKFLQLDIKILLIAVLAAIVLFQTCGGSKSKKPVETVKVDGKKYELLKYKIDTIYKTFIKYKFE